MEKDLGAVPDPRRDARDGTDPPQHYDAVTALGDTTAARCRMAERVITPWWYHPVLGLAQAAFVLVLAWTSTLGILVGAAGILGVALALKSVYQRTTGIWIGPDQLGPRSGRWFWALIALVLVVDALALFVWDTETSEGVVATGSAAVLLGTVLLGRTMDARLREEIRSGAAPAPAKGAR